MFFRLAYLFFLSFLVSCQTGRQVCPAYYSSFILDENAQKKQFHLYNDDYNKSLLITSTSKRGEPISLPPRDSTWVGIFPFEGPALPQMKRVQKDRYLIVKTSRESKKLNTVPKKTIYPKFDSLQLAQMALEDSLARLDTSRYVITLAKEKYNVEQNNYLWYLKDKLVLPDVRIAQEKENSDLMEDVEKSVKDSIKTAKKERKKKKQKKEKTKVKESSPPEGEEEEDPPLLDVDIPPPTTTEEEPLEK